MHNGGLPAKAATCRAVRPEASAQRIMSLERPLSKTASAAHDALSVDNALIMRKK
jgi:hypothetical protein